MMNLLYRQINTFLIHFRKWWHRILWPNDITSSVKNLVRDAAALFVLLKFYLLLWEPLFLQRIEIHLWGKING